MTDLWVATGNRGTRIEPGQHPAVEILPRSAPGVDARGGKRSDPFRDHIVQLGLDLAAGVGHRVVGRADDLGCRAHGIGVLHAGLDLAGEQIAALDRHDQTAAAGVREVQPRLIGRHGAEGIDEGTQIIGWDPVIGQVRSWTFDSSGGFAQGAWSNSKGRWYVHKKGTTADGKTTTAVNHVTPVDENTFAFQSTQRTLAGQLLPNLNEVLVVRQ